MANCLKTQLKSSVQDENLPVFNALTVHIKPGTVDINRRFIIVAQNPAKAYVVGNGYINTVYENLETEKKKEVTLNNYPSVNSIYLSNGTYDVVIENKYGFTRFECGSFMNNVIEGVSSFKYLENIVTFSFVNGSLSGGIEELSGLTALNSLYLENNNIYGDLSSLGTLINITSLQLFSNNISGLLEEFVRNQINSGRSSVDTSHSINCNHILKYATFGGNHYNETYCYLVWESINKIAVYAGASGISNCTKVYCKGYTQEEAEAAFSGKTIVRVDA